jgi:hypothetical protein
MCLCSLSLQQIRGAVFRIFVRVFCISGRGFCRCVGITPRSAVLSSLYLFFVILYSAALPYPFTQSFVYVTCQNPCTTKHVGCKVCFSAATNNEQYFIPNDAIFSQPRSAFA